MKHVWIVMLVIPYVIWWAISVFDLAFSIKYEKEIKFFTAMFITIHPVVIFLYSIFLWLSNS